MYRLFRRQIQASARRRGCLASLEGFQNPSKGGEKSPGGEGRLCIRRPGELPWKCAAFSTSLRYFPEELCVRLMAPRISHNSKAEMPALAGAKAHVHLSALAARLKSCPVTKRESKAAFERAVKSWP